MWVSREEPAFVSAEGERRESGCPLVQPRSPLPTSRDLLPTSQRVSRRPVTGSEHRVPSATPNRGDPGWPPLGRLWSPAPPRNLQASCTQASQVGGAALPQTFLRSGLSPCVQATSHPGPPRVGARAHAEADTWEWVPIPATSTFLFASLGFLPFQNFLAPFNKVSLRV